MDIPLENQRLKRQHRIHIVIGILAILLCIVVLYIDITTNWWGETVILSGMAAGLVTYLVTSLVVDRMVHRDEAEQWNPVTKLAVRNMLHNLTVDPTEDPLGERDPRGLTAPAIFTDESVTRLRQEVVIEGEDIAGSLAHWSSFLSSNADVQPFVVVLAQVAQELDDVDAAIQKWSAAKPDAKATAEATVNKEIDEYNTQVQAAITQGQRDLRRL